MECVKPSQRFCFSCEWLLGKSAHTWDESSSSRCDSKLRIISSKDLPVGEPEG